jgi:hypothetical protein
MEKKRIYDVIIIEIDSPEAPEHFFCQGGLSGPGHSHEQN